MQIVTDITGIVLRPTAVAHLSMFQEDKDPKQAYPLSGTPPHTLAPYSKVVFDKKIMTVQELAICWLEYPRDT